jgi:hypothetical protein
VSHDLSERHEQVQGSHQIVERNPGTTTKSHGSCSRLTW